MRPTAKDLAKAAGVSLATVDRVLNDRPNVSKKAAKAVNDAIERIGFVRNPAAVNLARNTTYRFRFILPKAGDQYLDEIIREIRMAGETLKSEMVALDIAQIAIEDSHRLANYLAALDRSKVDGVVILAPESPQVRDALLRLNERGIHLVRFLSGTTQTAPGDFVGIDNFAAGATAARILGRFLGSAKGSVLVIADTMRAQDSIERRLGFDHVIYQSFPGLNVLPSLETHADAARTKRIVSRALEHNKDIVGIYVASSEARASVSCIEELARPDHLVIVVHERTPFSTAALSADRIDAVIAQNPGHAVRSAIRILRARCEGREPVQSQDQLRIEILLKDNL